MPVVVDQDLCISCGVCISVCPVSALFMNDNDKAECEPSLCIDCGACIPVCPVTAIVQD